MDMRVQQDLQVQFATVVTVELSVPLGDVFREVPETSGNIVDWSQSREWRTSSFFTTNVMTVASSSSVRGKSTVLALNCLWYIDHEHFLPNFGDSSLNTRGFYTLILNIGDLIVIPIFCWIFTIS